MLEPAFPLPASRRSHYKRGLDVLRESSGSPTAWETIQNVKQSEYTSSPAFVTTAIAPHVRVDYAPASVVQMNATLVLRSCYLGAAIGVILVYITPPLRNRFLAYGPRGVDSSSSASNEEPPPTNRQSTGLKLSLDHLLDYIAQWRVPHDFFWLFYALSTALSLSWLCSYLFLHDSTLRIIDRWANGRSTTMSLEQVKIGWTMMSVQGVRRLYECTSLEGVSKKSHSQMWIGHWLLGMFFYTATSVAIWIEGVPSLKSHNISLRDLSFRAPTFRTILSVLVFIFASGFQHDCHAYLANLKSSSSDGKQRVNHYKVPTHPAFSSLIAPHYFSECLIYFSLAVVAAPSGAWLNWTLSSALIFVVVNLGITAGGTRQWYQEKFGADAVQGKWNMIPLLY